jgi:hypothetical protein
MERRDFLSSLVIGAGAGALAGPVAGCGATLPHGATLLGAREADALSRRLEVGLGAIRSELPPAFAAAPSWELRPSSHERLIRTGLEALVVADVARSIPEGSVVEGELAVKLREALSVLDACALGYHDLLASTPPAARRNVDRSFRARPELAMELAEWMDGGAARFGVSNESRLKLRSAAHRVGTRIRRQSSAALVEDTTSKVGSLLARSGGDLAALRASTTAALLDGVWGQLESVPPAPTGSTRPVGSRPATSWQLVDPERPSGGGELSTGERPGDSELTAGGIMIGVGLGVFGLGTLIGWAAGSAMWGAIISATPGSILVVLGLIFLIIGAVQNS